MKNLFWLLMNAIDNGDNEMAEFYGNKIRELATKEGRRG